KPEPDKKWKDCLQLILAGDFLSPIFLSMITGDLFGVQSQDRAVVLEESWEARYLSVTEQQPVKSDGKEVPTVSTLARPMLSVRDSVLKAGGWLPILLLNGTSVQTGRRIIASDVATDKLFQDAYDLHDIFGPPPPPGKKESKNERLKAWDIRLST